MKPIRFRVRDRHEDGRYWEVRVFDTREEMRTYAHKLKPYEDPGEYANAEALCMPIITIHIDGRGETESKRQGFLLFHQGQVGGAVVAHEMIHAALNSWRVREGEGVVSLGESCDEQEERLAHGISDLVNAVDRGMYAHGVWKEK